MAQLLTGTRIYGTGTVDTRLFINGNIASTSTNSGSLQVLGGVGISGNLWVGGTINGTAAGAGTATTATQIQTVSQVTSGTYYPTFVSANNASPTGMSVYTTSSFSINPYSGHVGIRKANSTAPLEIGDESGTTDPWIRIRSTASNIRSAFIQLTGRQTGVDEQWSMIAVGSALGNGGLRFTRGDWQNGTVAMIIDSSGNVGIGTDGLVTSAPLQVAAPLSSGTIVTVGMFTQNIDTALTVGSGARLVLAAGNSQSRAATIEAAVESGLNAHYLAFSTNANGANPTEKIRITSSGNVLIGFTTTQIGSKLEVSGGAYFTGITTITNVTSATSTITGALQVVGGVGIQGSLWVGGTINGTISNAGAATSSTQVITASTLSTASQYLTFVTDNNTTATSEYIYTTSSVRVTPSTGELTAQTFMATGGFISNNATISKSYTIASGTNAMSVGPVTISSGASVTVASGQRWVIL